MRTLPLASYTRRILSTPVVRRINATWSMMSGDGRRKKTIQEKNICSSSIDIYYNNTTPLFED